MNIPTFLGRWSCTGWLLRHSEYGGTMWYRGTCFVAHSQVELASVLSHPSQLFGQVLQSGTKYAWWWEDVMCHGGVLRTASTEVFITLQVVNPDWPLRRCSLCNVWCLRSTSDPRHGYKPQTSSNYRLCRLHTTMTAQYGTHSIRFIALGCMFLLFELFAMLRSGRYPFR